VNDSLKKDTTMKIEMDYTESSEILQDSLKKIGSPVGLGFWTKSPLIFSVIKLREKFTDELPVTHAILPIKYICWHVIV
jgi:hypothetical protein